MKPDDRAIERLDGTRKGRPRRHRLGRGEGGIVLAVSLLIITVLSILGAAFLAMSLNENLVTRWNRDITQSLYLGDLGIERTMNELNQRFADDGTKSDLDAELTTSGGYLFGSSSTYVAVDLPLPGGGTYRVGEFRVLLTNNTDGGVPSEDDQDRAVWATADGRVTVGGKTRNKQVVALLSPTTPSAITFGCPPTGTHTLKINGNLTILGARGSVHSNCHIDFDATTSIADDLTASGTIYDLGYATVGGTTAQGVPRVTVPTVNPATFRPLADYVMKEWRPGEPGCPSGCAKIFQSDGTTLVFDATGGGKWPCCDGWQFSGTPGDSGKWVYGSDTMYAQLQGKTLYFEKAPGTTAGVKSANVEISASPGTVGNEWQVALLAEGHIDISGNPLLRADSANLLMVAGTDIKIGGNYTSPWPGGGIIAAHEQMVISGNPEFTGVVIIENAAATDSYVSLNEISGNPKITYSGAPAPPAAWYPIRVLAWREVRG